MSMDSVSIKRGQAMLSQLNPKSFIGGFKEVTDQAQQAIELIPGVSIGFSNGGIIGQTVFEECKHEIIRLSSTGKSCGRRSRQAPLSSPRRRTLSKSRRRQLLSSRRGSSSTTGRRRTAAQ